MSKLQESLIHVEISKLNNSKSHFSHFYANYDILQAANLFKNSKEKVLMHSPVGKCCPAQPKMCSTTVTK